MKFETRNCVPANMMPQTSSGGQHADQASPAAHHQNQVGGHDQRNGCANAADAGAEPGQREAGHLLQRDDRNADGAERHGRGVRQQANAAA